MIFDGGSGDGRGMALFRGARNARRAGKSRPKWSRSNRITLAVILIPAAWGFLFGVFHDLAQSGFSAPYDWMKSVALPVADALAPFFPAIDHVTGEFVAHGYGGRAEFGRCVAGMAAFFMAVFFVASFVYHIISWKGKGKFLLLLHVRRPMRKSPEKYLITFAGGIGLFGWAAYEMAAGGMMLDWESSRLLYYKRILAFQRESWAAGMTMFMATGTAVLWGLIFIGVPRMILISLKVERRRRSRREGGR